MPSDPLAAFEPRIVSGVARDRNIDPTELSAVVRRHQEGVRELPGVDDLVYEWRRTLPGDPLLVRTPSAFVLRVPDGVWTEFGTYLELGESELAALRTVHDRQAKLLVEGGEESGLDGWTAVVLTR